MTKDTILKVTNLRKEFESFDAFYNPDKRSKKKVVIKINKEEKSYYSMTKGKISN